MYIRSGAMIWRKEGRGEWEGLGRHIEGLAPLYIDLHHRLLCLFEPPVYFIYPLFQPYMEGGELEKKEHVLLI